MWEGEQANTSTRRENKQAVGPPCSGSSTRMSDDAPVFGRLTMRVTEERNTGGGRDEVEAGIR